MIIVAFGRVGVRVEQGAHGAGFVRLRLGRLVGMCEAVKDSSVVGEERASQVVDALMKRKRRLLGDGGFESDACSSERLGEKLGSGEGD